MLRSSREQKILVVNGHTFWKHRELKDGYISWRCSLFQKTGCRARVRTNAGLIQVPDGEVAHEYPTHSGHDSSPGEVGRRIVLNDVKTRARETVENSTSESSSEAAQSSTISSTKERTLTPVVPPSKPHSSTDNVAIPAKKKKGKKSIFSHSFCIVETKKAQKREDEIALRRNAARIAEFQALQKKKAEMKKNEKVPPRKLRGQIIEGLPPPGPVGWEPDQISARKFKHMGPLKWEQRPPVTMVHALENDEPPVLNPDQHIEWDDEQNFVVDIGSEVEEVYRNGQRVMPAKRPSAQPPARNTPRRSAENRQLKAIRED
ncbi:hypothetical protein M3Y98_00994200 [Aphelenchoides besseyi]|nr:hypothetical protein M3Y98_00994200 [Aphelenchoides besseyi]